jgi:hypothetical protein
LLHFVTFGGNSLEFAGADSKFSLSGKGGFGALTYYNYSLNGNAIPEEYFRWGASTNWYGITRTNGVTNRFSVYNTAENMRFSINTLVADATMSIKGEGATSATTALLVENSLGTELFKILDNGIISGNIPNFANTDLTLDANRTHSLNGYDLSLSNTTRAVFKVTDAGAVEVLNSTTNRGLLVQAGGVPSNNLRLYAASNAEYIKSNNTLRILAQNVHTAMFSAKRMSLNSTTLPIPSTLYIKGEGSTSATTALLVENSLGTDLLKIDDAGGFALGSGATYFGSQTVTIGNGSSTTVDRAIAIGNGSSSTSDGAIAIGHLALANGSSSSPSIAIGQESDAAGFRSVAMGWRANASGSNAVAIGQNATSTGAGVAINGTATLGLIAIRGVASAANAIALGGTASQQTAVAIGSTSQATNFGSIALGYGAVASGSNSYIIRSSTSSTRTNSTSNSMEVHFSQADATFRFGQSVDGWLNSTGNFGLGLNTGISAKLHIESSSSVTSNRALLVENSLSASLLEINDAGNLGIGTAPSLSSRAYITTSTEEVSLRVENIATGTTPVSGLFITGGTVTGGTNTGVDASAYGNDTLNIGVRGNAGNPATGINVGGYFK